MWATHDYASMSVPCTRTKALQTDLFLLVLPALDCEQAVQGGDLFLTKRRVDREHIGGVLSCVCALFWDNDVLQLIGRYYIL